VSVDSLILRLKSLVWGNVETSRVLSMDSPGCGVPKGLSEQVLTLEAFHVASVPRDLLVSHHVIWSALPIFCKSTTVSKYLIIRLLLWRKFSAIESLGLVGFRVEIDGVLSLVSDDVPLD